MSHFAKLWRRVADVQDEERQALQTTERGADRFIKALRRERRHRPAVRLLAAALLVAAAIPVLIWMFIVRAGHTPPQGSAIEANQARKIVVPKNQTIPVHF